MLLIMNTLAKYFVKTKTKPKLQCNGKCQLMKGLAKAIDTENPVSSDKKSFSPVQEVLFFKEIKTYNLVSSSCSKQTKNSSSYLNLYSFLNANSEFHPPTFISLVFSNEVAFILREIDISWDRLCCSLN